MTTGTGMLTDPRLLTLTQWLSPAYPLGSFAYSHGLETAIAEGWVSGAPSLKDWLTGVLDTGSGRTDAILLHLAFRAEDPTEIDALAQAYAPSAERLRESTRQGAAFAKITRDVWKIDLPTLLLPVALGRAAALVDLPAPDTAALFLQSFTANLTSAVQRLMPIGQTAAQQVLAELTPLCAEIAIETADATEDDLASTAWLSDIAAMRHETLQPRLFQS